MWTVHLDPWATAPTTISRQETCHSFGDSLTPKSPDWSGSHTAQPVASSCLGGPTGLPRGKGPGCPPVTGSLWLLCQLNHPPPGIFLAWSLRLQSPAAVWSQLSLLWFGIFCDDLYGSSRGSHGGLSLALGGDSSSHRDLGINCRSVFNVCQTDDSGVCSSTNGGPDLAPFQPQLKKVALGT